MKKIIVFGLLVALIGLLLPLEAVYAKAKFRIPENDEAVIALGQAKDRETGEQVEGYAIIHRVKNKQKNFNQRSPKFGGCYAYLADGAKWKRVENWVVNPSNASGLTSDFIFNNLSFDIEKWEDAADGILANGQSVNMVGSGLIVSEPLEADLASPDGQNEVYFADVTSSGAIAITIVWGIFGGPIRNRQLVEWDQVYDDVDYNWSSSGEADKIDFENVATHELGHTVGMADLYNSTCSEETMFGYADFGETKKQTLNRGDISGINRLY